MVISAKGITESFWRYQSYDLFLLDVVMSFDFEELRAGKSLDLI